MPRNDFGTKPRPPTSSPSGGADKTQGTPAKAPMPERVANWGGLPGSPQRKDRSGGVDKLKADPVKKGL